MMLYLPYHTRAKAQSEVLNQWSMPTALAYCLLPFECGRIIKESGLTETENHGTTTAYVLRNMCLAVSPGYYVRRSRHCQGDPSSAKIDA